MNDTIFALSSGAPPAGIGVIRITGPQAQDALRAIIGKVPAPRKLYRADFKASDGTVLDDGLAVFFPGPHSVSGEDLAELHCHGGRAVIVAVEKALGEVSGCRKALAGEFTKRAFANGQIDLNEAEGLADLLEAETEIARRSAMAMAGGAFSNKVEGWREALLGLSAQIEAALDFSEEDDIEGLPQSFSDGLEQFGADLGKALLAPRAETVKEGFRVALAGPPNAGKSTLFNALTNSDAAIITELAGTTRDVLVRPVAIAGIPFSFVDMAGLRENASDKVEAIGIERAHGEITRADLVLWLGVEGEGPEAIGSCEVWEIGAQSDRDDRQRKEAPDHIISARNGEGMEALLSALIAAAQAHMPTGDATALSKRQRDLLAQASEEISVAIGLDDPLLVAEHLRGARSAFDALLGRTSTEDVFDAIFGRFCLGK